MFRPSATAIRDLLVLGGLADFEKFRVPVRGPKRAKNGKKWIFPVFGAVLGETLADQICLHVKCGPCEPCLGSHVSLGPGTWGRGGALLRQFGTGSVCQEPNRFGASGVFWEMFGSPEPRSHCATFSL